MEYFVKRKYTCFSKFDVNSLRVFLQINPRKKTSYVENDK